MYNNLLSPTIYCIIYLFIPLLQAFVKWEKLRGIQFKSDEKIERLLQLMKMKRNVKRKRNVKWWKTIFVAKFFRSKHVSDPAKTIFSSECYFLPPNFFFVAITFIAAVFLLSSQIWKKIQNTSYKETKWIKNPILINNVYPDQLSNLGWLWILGKENKIENRLV